MPLENRVDPFGTIHAVAARGMFTGNRGVIHDPETGTLTARRWTTKAWIVCALDFRGRRREPMGRNAPSGGAGWTGLYFLDEVTALAAGHRPCFFCRRERAKDYAGFFADAFAVSAPRAAEIDARLHAERPAAGAVTACIARTGLAALPDATMVALGDVAYAVRAGRLLEWSFGGYGGGFPVGRAPAGDWRRLTPAATVAVLAAGYRPAWHGSAT